MARPASRLTVLPSDVVQETFVSGLALTVAFELAPDDHQLFVSELYGSVRLVVDGELRPDPIVTLPTTQGLAQGTLGLALSIPHSQPTNYDTAGEKEAVAQSCRLYVRTGPDGALYFSDHHAIYRLGPPRS